MPAAILSHPDLTTAQAAACLVNNCATSEKRNSDMSEAANNLLTRLKEWASANPRLAATVGGGLGGAGVGTLLGTVKKLRDEDRPVATGALVGGALGAGTAGLAYPYVSSHLLNKQADISSAIQGIVGRLRQSGAGVGGKLKTWLAANPKLAPAVYGGLGGAGLGTLLGAGKTLTENPEDRQWGTNMITGALAGGALGGGAGLAYPYLTGKPAELPAGFQFKSTDYKGRQQEITQLVKDNPDMAPVAAKLQAALDASYDTTGNRVLRGVNDAVDYAAAHPTLTTIGGMDAAGALARRRADLTTQQYLGGNQSEGSTVNQLRDALRRGLSQTTEGGTKAVETAASPGRVANPAGFWDVLKRRPKLDSTQVAAYEALKSLHDVSNIEAQGIIDQVRQYNKPFMTAAGTRIDPKQFRTLMGLASRHDTAQSLHDIRKIRPVPSVGPGVPPATMMDFVPSPNLKSRGVISSLLPAQDYTQYTKKPFSPGSLAALPLLRAAPTRFGKWQRFLSGSGPGYRAGARLGAYAVLPMLDDYLWNKSQQPPVVTPSDGIEPSTATPQSYDPVHRGF